MEGGSTLDIGRLCWASFFLTVLLFTDSHPGWARQPAKPIVAEAQPSPSPAPDSQQSIVLPEKPIPPEKRKTKVPILVYHHIKLISDGSPGLRRLTVTAEVFGRQMKFLQDNGYHVITFSDVAD